MDLHEFSASFRALWENKPGIILLLILGFFVFLFLVVDAWRHKRYHKRRHHGRWRP